MANTILSPCFCFECGALCTSVVNAVDLSILRETRGGVHIKAGSEIGVASTKVLHLRSSASLHASCNANGITSLMLLADIHFTIHRSSHDGYPALRRPNLAHREAETDHLQSARTARANQVHAQVRQDSAGSCKHNARQLAVTGHPRARPAICDVPQGCTEDQEISYMHCSQGMSCMFLILRINSISGLISSMD